MELKITPIQGAPEPVSLEQAKNHLGVALEFSDDDNLINILISAARERAELYCNRSFQQKTIDLFLDHWPGAYNYYSGVHGFVKLPRGPVKQINSIEYLADGTYQEFEGSYTLNDAMVPPKLFFTSPLPAIIAAPMCVKITYTTGYDETNPVPDPVRAAIFMMIRTMYDHREDMIKGTIMTANKNNSEYLLNNYRIFEFL
jgi:uncharacterized phiE125 gp8 family phage protein